MAADRAREVDVAFVLEGIEGVREVYALEPATHIDSLRMDSSSLADRTSEQATFAIQIVPGGRALAAAQCALLRVLKHDECRGVAFFETFLPARIAARAKAIRLTAEERERARARVAAPLSEIVPLVRPRASHAGLSLIVVDDDPAVLRLVSSAPGSESVGRLEIQPDPTAALSLARREQFDVLLCAVEAAFGKNGLLDLLLLEDSVIAATVVLLTQSDDRERLAAELDRRLLMNAVLEKPLPADLYRLLTCPAEIVPPWLMPIPAPRRPPRVRRAVRAPMRVLVIDDDHATEARLYDASDEAMEIVLSDNVWDALEHVATKDYDLVFCSAAMRASPIAPLYRFLWQSVPDMKTRFVLVLSPDAEPGSSATASRRLIERPLTRDAVRAAVDRFFAE